MLSVVRARDEPKSRSPTYLAMTRWRPTARSASEVHTRAPGGDDRDAEPDRTGREHDGPVARPGRCHACSVDGRRPARGDGGSADEERARCPADEHGERSLGARQHVVTGERGEDHVPRGRRQPHGARGAATNDPRALAAPQHPAVLGEEHRSARRRRGRGRPVGGSDRRTGGAWRHRDDDGSVEMPSGRTGFEGPETAPGPARFTARTTKVYGVPFDEPRDDARAPPRAPDHAGARGGSGLGRDGEPTDRRTAVLGRREPGDGRAAVAREGRHVLGWAGRADRRGDRVDDVRRGRPARRRSPERSARRPPRRRSRRAAPATRC